MLAEAERDSRIIGIHAAMGGGTGMNRFSARFPERTFDVGIAEQHAVGSPALHTQLIIPGASPDTCSTQPHRSHMKVHRQTTAVTALDIQRRFVSWQVTFAAGLACEGLVPFCAIYSTFLQRGFDQVVHDVALQDLPGKVPSYARLLGWVNVYSRVMSPGLVVGS